MNNHPEIRHDLITGDWVIIAPHRRSRPHLLASKKKQRVFSTLTADPFFEPQKKGNPEPVLVLPDRRRWKIQVLENKYPALTHSGRCTVFINRGPYLVSDSIGYHELIITRHPRHNFSELSPADAFMVLEAAAARFREYRRDRCVKYAIFFQNWGETAGASVPHPHYQLAALPIVPPEMERAVKGAATFHRQHHTFAYQSVIAWEKKHRRRIIFANSLAIAFTRYASKEPFDVRIFPQAHLPHFEDTDQPTLHAVTAALQTVLRKIKRRLGDPDYNFYLHTAPLNKNGSSSLYHWHIDVVPRISISAGFEIGTGVEITTVDPDDAADILNR